MKDKDEELRSLSAIKAYLALSRAQLELPAPPSEMGMDSPNLKQNTAVGDDIGQRSPPQQSVSCKGDVKMIEVEGSKMSQTAADALQAPPAGQLNYHQRYHAVLHLTQALISHQKAQAVKGQDLKSMSLRTAAYSKAAGQALAFLLHPDSGTTASSPVGGDNIGSRKEAANAKGAIPPNLLVKASEILSQSSEMMGSFSAASLGAKGAGSGNTSSGAGSTDMPALWGERASKSNCFKKLLELTGLKPVKQAMCEVADKVRSTRLLVVGTLWGAVLFY
jgi:hypothetical protein